MVLMNCFEGRSGDTEVENRWTCGHSRRVSEWDEWRKYNQHIYTITCKMKSWWEVAMQHRESSLALCDDLEGCNGWREGSSKGRGYMYNYDWLLSYDRNQHNTVKKIKKQEINILFQLYLCKILWIHTYVRQTLCMPATLQHLKIIFPFAIPFFQAKHTGAPVRKYAKAPGQESLGLCFYSTGSEQSFQKQTLTLLQDMLRCYHRYKKQAWEWKTPISG